MAVPRCSALEKAIRILTVSAKTGHELKAKLLQSGYSPTEAESAIEECIKRGYINDALFAADFAEANLGRGSGCRKIRQKLLRRGIDRELVAQTLEECSASEPESARQALIFKWKSLSREKDPYKKRAKAFRFLAGRGYPPALISELIEEISRSGEDFPENETEIL